MYHSSPHFCLSRSFIHRDFLPGQVDVDHVNFTSQSIITLWFFIFPWPNTCCCLQCLCQHQAVSNWPALPLSSPVSHVPPVMVISYQLQISKASVSYTCKWLKISCGRICLLLRWRIVLENIHFILSSDVLLGKCIGIHYTCILYIIIFTIFVTYIIHIYICICVYVYV